MNARALLREIAPSGHPPALQVAHSLCSGALKAAPSPPISGPGVGHTSCSTGEAGGTAASPGGMG